MLKLTCKYIFILIGWHLFVSLQAFGQEYVYKNYTVSDGIPSSEVYHCLQDSKGYMWFATDNGVSRFDGYKFVNFDIQSGLVNNTVLDLFEDWRGRIWFISLSPKLCYYEDGKIVPYQYNSKIVAATKGYSLPIKQAFYVDSLDNVYFSLSNNGIIKVNSSGNITHLINEKFEGKIYLAQISSAKTIAGTVKVNLINGVVKNDSIINFNIEAIKGNQSLLFNVKGYKDEIYLGYKNSIYYIKNGKIERIVDFSNDILWFSMDKNGDYWISIRTQGILYYKKPDFISKPDLIFFPGKSISSVFIDNENAFWFTSLNDGAFYVPTCQINSFNLSGFNSKNVQSVGLSPDKVWISLQNVGILTFDKNIEKILEKLTLDKLDQAIEISFHPQLDKLIIGSEHSIYTFDGSKLVNITVNKYNKSCRCIFIGKDHSFYSGTNYGLYKFCDNEIIYNSGKNSTFDKIVYSICENQDSSIWIGTQDGLWKFENGEYINWATKNTLLSYRINVLYKYKDKLIIGTKGAGLVMMNLNNFSCKTLTKSDGLSSNSISSITGKADEIWLGTNHGISRLKFFSDSAFQISRIDAGTGLHGDEVNELVLNDNILYIATKSGFNFINLDEFKWTDAKPFLHIENVSINSKDTLSLNNYDLNYYQNNLQISFVAISYKSNKSILYKYKLIPLENEWKDTYETSINYTTLPPGSYSLFIKARNESGIWSDTDRTIKFTIDKPFWNKWWFYLLSLAVFGLMVYLFFIQRINLLKSQNRLKKELNVYMQNAVNLVINDHFLFNSLNSLNHLILSGEKMESSKLLSKISNYCRGILLTIRKDFISLNEEINILKIYLEIEKFRLKDKFVYYIEIDKDLDVNQIYVPGAFFQPFIETSIWSGSTTDNEKIVLNIQMKLDNNYLLIIVQINSKEPDNQKNISKSPLKQKNVQDITSILRKRAQLINSFYSSDIQIEYLGSENKAEDAVGRVLKIKADVRKLKKRNLK